MLLLSTWLVPGSILGCMIELFLGLPQYVRKKIQYLVYSSRSIITAFLRFDTI
jgi:hypothetical protein